MFTTQSTLSVLTGFGFIAAWIFIGFFGIHLWAACFSVPLTYRWKTWLAIVFGPLTFCLVVVWIIAAAVDDVVEDL